MTDNALELLQKYHAPMFKSLSDKQHEQLREALTVMHDYTCGGNWPGGCHTQFQKITE